MRKLYADRGALSLDLLCDMSICLNNARDIGAPIPARNVQPMSVDCRVDVTDVGLALNQHSVDDSRLLRWQDGYNYSKRSSSQTLRRQLKRRYMVTIEDVVRTRLVLTRQPHGGGRPASVAPCI